MKREQFLPTKKNDYRPHVLQKGAVVAMGVLALLTFAIANIHSFVWTSSDWLVSTILPAVIVEETNAEREKASLGELSRNSVLDAAATAKAKDMAAKGYFSHYGPDGTAPWDWIAEQDYTFIHAGENLAVHFTDSAAVVEAWMNSPAHRENIMGAQYQEIGVGTAKGQYQGFDTIFVVQMFGTPATTAAASIPRVEQPDPSTLDESEVVLETEAPEQVAGERSDAEELESTPSETTTNTTTSESGHVVVTSNHLSTSSDATTTPATVGSTQTSGSTISWLGITTQPKVVLETVYFLLGLFVVAAVLLSIIIEIKHQRPLQIGYGFGLLVFMYVLFQVHITMVGGVVIT